MVFNYEKLSDKDLVTLHREKKINALTTLYYRYKDYSYAFIYKTLSKTSYLNKILDFKDSIMLKALVQAIKAFDESKGLFKHIYINIVKKEIIKKIIEFDKNPLTNYISLDEELNNAEGLTMMDVIADERENPNEFKNNVDVNKKISETMDKLDERTKKILKLKEEGKSYEEIAKEMNCSIYAAYGLIYRYRVRMKKKK